MTAQAGVHRLATRLAERVEKAPIGPWLFFREGIDWKWRSWARMADQVARAALLCQDWRRANAGAGLEILGSWRPDAVTACLAAAASGLEVDMSSDRDAESSYSDLPGSDDVGQGVEVELRPAGGCSGPGPVLPVCRGPLEAYDAVPLEVTGATSGLKLDGDLWTWPQLCASRDRFEAAVVEGRAASGKSASGKPPIVFASASLPAGLFATLLAWSLETGAPWVVEPDRDAFAGVAWWTRPEVLVATAEEIEALAGHFDRSARRRSRLQVVIAADRAVSREAAEQLGAPMGCFELG